MRLVIGKETKSRLPEKMIRELFENVVQLEAEPDWKATVNVIFTSDRTIRRLNRKHRGLDKPTDVLSFNIDRPEEDDAVFGEVYISTDTAGRQAREFGVRIEDEYLRLACHGFLHLFGHDHKKTDDAKRMRRLEARCLEAIGRS